VLWLVRCMGKCLLQIDQLVLCSLGIVCACACAIWGGRGEGGWEIQNAKKLGTRNGPCVEDTTLRGQTFA